MKEVVRDLFVKNMMGYSSESANKYLENKGLKNGEKYKIDETHYFVAFAGKGYVRVCVFYRNREIDVRGYLQRNGLI